MQQPGLSRRVGLVRPSVTMAVAQRARELAESGVSVVSLGAGEPDFDTPEPIRRAAIEALEAGQTRYMPTTGDVATRRVIADKLRQENGLEGIGPEHVAICAGAKHALYMVLQCLIEPGEPGQPPQELLLPVPGWVSYAAIGLLAGARVVELPTTPQGGFKITPAQLRAAITPRSRVLMLNSPANPTGAMYTRAELEALAEVVAEAAGSIAPGLVVVTDEIYEKIIFGPTPHVSFGAIPAVAARTVTVNGLSKAYAMTGWRTGYAAAPGPFGRDLMQAIATLQGQMTSNITSFCYAAMRVALRDCASTVEQMRTVYARRAALASELLSRLPRMPFVPPQGAYYLFPDVSAWFGTTTPAGRTIGTALDLADALLEEAHVAVVPGEDFGGCGGNHIRISFACSEEQIREGFDRLDRFLASLR